MATKDHRDIELLAPETAKQRRDYRLKPREFEDAEFETVIPCDGYGAPEGLFIPAVTPEAGKPIFARAETAEFAAERQRLDLFSRRGTAVPQNSAKAQGLAGAVLLCGVVAIALVGFSLTVGARIGYRQAEADPVTTGSIPVKPQPAAPIVVQRPAAAVSPPMPTQGAMRAAEAERASGPAAVTVEEAPRPARIERAGSILMIRAGD